ncbi:peptidylprolyl isomerase [Candidatus Woesearchaeota archaeon B3_Woes]|nr:MAG: peptidylprolyl isomerase [Candidatus Woesearchaeota archaeon B3_Woes]
MPIKKGDKIKVDYTGTFDDGNVFDTSEGKQPIEFEVGAGQLIKGFDEAVVGMEKGQEKEIKLSSSEAYGDVNPELIKKVPRDKLPKDKEIKPGMVLGMGTPDGKQIPVRVTDANDKEITIDLNHPLAGKNLNFKIKVVEIVS